VHRAAFLVAEPGVVPAGSGLGETPGVDTADVGDAGGGGGGGGVPAGGFGAGEGAGGIPGRGAGDRVGSPAWAATIPNPLPVEILSPAR
jgi:hypothetical protein